MARKVIYTYRGDIKWCPASTTASWDLPFGIWVAGVVYHILWNKNKLLPLSRVPSFVRLNGSAVLGNGEYLPHKGEEVHDIFP
jgi:hypothetical protein